MRLTANCEPGMVVDEGPYRLLIEELRRAEREFGRRHDWDSTIEGPVRVWFDFVTFSPREVRHRQSSDGLEISFTPRVQTMDEMSGDQRAAWVRALIEHGLDVAVGDASFADYPACPATSPWPFTQVESLVRWGRRGKRWGGNALEDAFARRARCLTDLVEVHLAEHGLTSSVGPQLWLAPDPKGVPGGVSLSDQGTVAKVGVGRDFVRLPESGQAALVLGGIREAIAARGKHEGQDWTTHAEHVVGSVQQGNFQLDWQQHPWKSPRDRPDRRARTEYQQSPAGGQLRLVAEGPSMRTESPWVPAGPSLAAITSRAAASMNWFNDSTVEFVRPEGLEPGALHLQVSPADR